MKRHVGFHIIYIKVNFPVGHYLSALRHGQNKLYVRKHLSQYSCSLFLYFKIYFRNIVADTCHLPFISLFLVQFPVCLHAFFFACLDRGARRGLLEIEKLLATEILLSTYINYLPGSHKLQPSWKYDLAKFWDEIVDSGLGLTSTGNAELECCGRCCLQIPDQYIYKIEDHDTFSSLLKAKVQPC